MSYAGLELGGGLVGQGQALVPNATRLRPVCKCSRYVQSDDVTMDSNILDLIY